jgi:hypothetical protein
VRSGYETSSTKSDLNSSLNTNNPTAQPIDELQGIRNLETVNLTKLNPDHLDNRMDALGTQNNLDLDSTSVGLPRLSRSNQPTTNSIAPHGSRYHRATLLEEDVWVLI